MKLKWILGASLLGASTLSFALVESFDDVADSSGTTILTGLKSRGWAPINMSSPLGISGWFAGETSYIAADQSATTNKVNPGTNVEYLAANFDNTTNGTISNYLLSPVLSLKNGDSFSFETLSDGAYPDRMQILLSTKGASTNVGSDANGTGSDFATVLLTVNQNLTSNGYPTVWTDYVATVTGLKGPATGRFAFHYYVPNGGQSGANSSYIGIDNAVYKAAVPEPATFAALGLGLVALRLRRRNAK